MSLALVKGLVLLSSGLGYNKVQSVRETAKGIRESIKMDPHDFEPTPERYGFLKNKEEYLRDQELYNRYHLMRLYYFDLIYEQANALEDIIICSDHKKYKDLCEAYSGTKYSVRQVGSLQYCGKYCWEKEIDPRFQWIFDQMDEDCVSFEYRPGIDYYSNLGIQRSKWKDPEEFYPIYLLKKANGALTIEDALPLINEYSIKNIHLDYKKYWQD